VSEERSLLPLLGGYDQVRNCGRAFTHVDLFLPKPWFGKDGALNFFLSQTIKPGLPPLDLPALVPGNHLILSRRNIG
jgi:hypothetical protein